MRARLLHGLETETFEQLCLPLIALYSPIWGREGRMTEAEDFLLKSLVNLKSKSPGDLKCRETENKEIRVSVENVIGLVCFFFSIY